EHVLPHHDVLLLPSRREGLPCVVLEALAAGLPVLATDLPGLRELAAQLDGITLLPLDAGPHTWATTALQLATTPTTTRNRITTTLRHSPYTLAAATTNWTTLWKLRSRTPTP